MSARASVPGRSRTGSSTLQSTIAERAMRIAQADGRIISVLDRPIPDGGWITVHKDVTGEVKAETAVLSVVKRSGASEAFSRAKVISGVRKACQGRPVSEDDLALLAQNVEEAVRASGVAEVASHDVGLAILGPLRELDEVAYLRFASVYRAFDGLEDFEAEIALLRTERDLASTPPGTPP